ncbi:MAG: c-type cytochrome [Planctomycetota bacterium]
MSSQFDPQREKSLPTNQPSARPRGQFADFRNALLVAAVLLVPVLGWCVRLYWVASAYDRIAWAAPPPPPPVAEVAHGRDLFQMICVPCHGPNGEGVTSLGKNIARSNFIALRSDAELREFITQGRPEALPLPMPPKGGREDLTDADIAHIVTYVRCLQDPRRMPELPPPAPIAVAPPTAAEQAKALEAAGGNAELAEYIAYGAKLFSTVCIACHGAGGVGIKGNGKPLVNNEFVRSLDDDALLAFVKSGRNPGDPKNTTGIAMPPKGGNPALSEDDLLDIISYLRTLSPGKPNP